MSRCALHAAAGAGALVFAFLPPGAAIALSLALVAHNALVLPRYAPGLMRPPGSRADDGILAYPVVVAVATILFRHRLDLAAMVWGLLSFGDAAASAAGRRAGRARLPWNRTKSWTGSVAFVVAGAVGAGLLQGFVASHGRIESAGAAIGRVDPWVLAVVAAIAESLPGPLDDNVRIGAAAVLVLEASLAVEPSAEAAAAMLGRLPAAIGASGLLAAIGMAAGALTPSGAAAGVLLGTLTWAGGGPGAFAALAVFVVAGSAATRWRRERKAALGIAQPRGGRRSAAHALANGGVAAGLAGLAGVAGESGALLRLACVGALATAAADTVATEIGQAASRNARTLPGFVPAAPGTPGAVSAAGTAAGVVAGALVAATALVAGLVPGRAFPAVVLAATAATLVESLLGASAAVRGRLGGHGRNALATGLGAWLAAALAGRSMG